MGEMTVAKVDARGRVQLPKAIIEALDIKSGDIVRISIEKISVKSEGSALNPQKVTEPALA